MSLGRKEGEVKRVAMVLGLVGTLVMLPRGAAAVLVTDVYVPGITGEDSPPGFPGAMNVKSVSVSAGAFSAIKRVDSASPQIAAAVAGATPLGTSRVLLYDASPPGAQPDEIVVFHNVLGSSQLLAGGPTPREQDAFTFATITPEPAAGMGVIIAAVAACLPRRRVRKPGMKSRK